jgi:chromosome segregation ATPase
MLKEVFQKLDGRLTQYQGLEKKLVDSVNQTQKLIHDLDESRKEAGLLQDKLLQVESQAKKLQNDVYGLSQEKEQMVRLINTRTQELEQAKMEMGQLQGQVGQLRQKEARLREVEVIN